MIASINDVEFGKWLRKEIQRLGVSRTELVDLLSRPGEDDQRQNVYKWLDGKATPQWDSCQRIASVLGIDLDDVLIAAGRLKLPEEPGREDVPPPERADFPSPQQPPYEGGAAPLSSREIIELRQLLTLRAEIVEAATILTNSDRRVIRNILPALKGLTPAEVDLLRALVRHENYGEPGANGVTRRHVDEYEDRRPR